MQKYYCCACRKKVFAPFFRKITRNNIVRWREALAPIIVADCPFKVGSRLCSRHFECQDADVPTTKIHECPANPEHFEPMKRRRVTSRPIEKPTTDEPPTSPESLTNPDVANIDTLVNWLEMTKNERMQRVESTSRTLINTWAVGHSPDEPVCFECWLQEQENLMVSLFENDLQMQSQIPSGPMGGGAVSESTQFIPYELPVQHPRLIN